MMRITLDSPALVAVRRWLASSAGQQGQRSGRGGRRESSRVVFRGEQLEPRMMLDAGMRAMLPDLVAASDTGFSNNDNLTSDRTPTLTGSVRGAVSQVRLFVDGRRGDLLPVTNGTWTHEVPATAALAPGRHTFAVRPVHTSGRVGRLSRPLSVTIVTAAPNAPTLGLGPMSDSGAKGDGATTFARPMLRGIAQPGRLVSVSIDGAFAGRVRSNATTGEWSLRAPRLANGVHEITAVVENRAGIRSAFARLEVTVNGERTVMLDGSEGNAVELMASHLLGRHSRGFIVTQVHRGTLQRWSAVRNAWVTIPTGPLATDPSSLQKAPAVRRLAFNEVVRWTPARGDVGTAPAFAIVPQDTPGGLIAPAPEAGTVPGKVTNPRTAPLYGRGTSITWEAPTDGCGCASTRYAIEVTREDGQTLVYSVPRTVHGIPIVEGGFVQQARVWGATNTGAGVAVSYDLQSTVEALARIVDTAKGAASFIELEEKARAQLVSSLTPTRFTTSLPLGGSHADLAYLQVDAVPDAAEAAQGLPAGTPMIISSESSKLTPSQRADLQAHPIYASHLFPGTVNGAVLPDQVRAHFQAGERLRFSGTVDVRVRTGATVVVEKAQNLGDGSLGPWFQEARIPVGADGSFSHDYVVPYGLNSVRTRLEYRTQPAGSAVRPTRVSSVGATSSASQALSTSITLPYNAFGITTAPWQAPNNQGFDRNGNYYNSDYTGSGTDTPYTGTAITYAGISFPIGPIPTQDSQVGGSGNHADRNPYNFVQAQGQTINVSGIPADGSDYLYLAGAAANGNQTSQVITLHFTDGTTEEWTQSFHDWASVGPPQSDATTPSSHALLPVKVVATSNVVAAGLPQTIDGVAIVAGDRVLLVNQDDAAANGVYVAQVGAWPLAKDADTGAEILSSYTSVASGTSAGTTFVNTNTGTIDVGSTAITFVEGTPPVPAPRPFQGELLLKTEPERINQLGNLVATPAHIFAYCYNLKGKQLSKIDLPNNDNIGILSAVVARAPVIALDEGFASIVLGTTNLTGVDLVALTIANESNIGAGGGPLAFSFANQPVKGTTTSVAISGIATAGGIVTDGMVFSGGGFDGDGNAYSWQALGSSPTLRWNGVNFNLGRPELPNYVVADGQTIQVPQGNFTTVNLAGAAVNGGQQGQQITLTFTDGSTSTWTQSFSDWCSPQNYADEAIISTQSYRDTASGDTNQTTNHVYGYSYTIPSGKTLASITLPTNSDVRLLDIQMSPPTYTTTKVTVPMGQQQTIAYIAPDSATQMTFSVQKADNTCVGNCSTYLPDWTSGKGSSTDAAANITPSLNSQLKAGQHWTMTIQNAGEGYYGFLDSPHGQGLPGASGSTPAGAQFRLMTQTEINVQPPWAVALETVLGTTLLLVGLTIATGGGDILAGGAIGAVEFGLDGAEGGGTVALEYGPLGGGNAIEGALVDPAGVVVDGAADGAMDSASSIATDESADEEAERLERRRAARGLPSWAFNFVKWVTRA